MIRFDPAVRRDGAHPDGSHGAAAAKASDEIGAKPRVANEVANDVANDASAAKPTDVEETLRRYRRRKSPRLRDQVVAELHATVDAMARRLSSRLPPSVDLHDLVHAGVSGLIQAIENYDPALCDQFAAFAKIRIRGAMLDELRSMDSVPRPLRRRLREREAAAQSLRSELQREPTEAELAQALGVSLADLQSRYCQKGEQQALGGTGDEESGAFDMMDSLADQGLEPPIESASRQELVARIQESLDPIEWKVLQMHYLEGMTGRDIARRLRLSASRICQIHGRVLDRLKQQMVEREDRPNAAPGDATN